MILICAVSCQSNSPATEAPLPTLVSLGVDTAVPTREFQAIPTRDTTATFTPLPTLFPTQTSLPILIQPTIEPNPFVFGQSVFGRQLVAHRIGSGEQVIMLVGGIHGGWETNTIDLMNQLIQHFEQSPADLFSEISLLIVPVLNPDGAVRGRVLEGRFNDHQVDLNRNWGCDWQKQAYFRTQTVNAGEYAMSEPETQALSALIIQERPAVVLFYHSAANGIFTGECNANETGSAAMAAVLGEATGYSYGSDFSAYPVTGTAPSWVASLGIPSADVELETWQNTEFDRNLRGIMALQCWLLDCSL